MKVRNNNFNFKNSWFLIPSCFKVVILILPNGKIIQKSNTLIKSRVIGPPIALVYLCFRKNVIVTCKIVSFLCSLDNFLLKKCNCFKFWKNKQTNKQIVKWRSFFLKKLIFDLLFTFFSHQENDTKIPSAHNSLIYTVVFSSPYQGRIQPLERGGPKLLTNDGGYRGLASWRGLQGGRAPLRWEILNFWTQFARFVAYFLPTSYWKSHDLFPIKVFFFFVFLFVLFCFFWIME